MTVELAKLDAMWAQIEAGFKRPPDHDEAAHGWTVTQIMNRLNIPKWNTAKAMCARKARAGEWEATQVIAGGRLATAYKPRGGQS